MNNKVDGFQVLVLEGREITENQFAALSDEQKSKVQRKLNGPHHDSKWAQHLKPKFKFPIIVKNGTGSILVHC